MNATTILILVALLLLVYLAATGRLVAVKNAVEGKAS